ncbi:hypothetical protein BCR44DRAFT_59673 [Catenaria anguillulae PL171]|uniref:Transmembrane protein 242 n=1 Tax=Catenaria anguillulae PL171 TaxID=765915 RepID=A0A1Y2HNW4_9FUNG|nr:hypothetical protein BCR44DRAFT_59673 [Catenaria anguillulae PL171]
MNSTSSSLNPSGPSPAPSKDGSSYSSFTPIIRPGTALSLAAGAFVIGIGASWIMAKRGKLPNPGALTGPRSSSIAASPAAASPAARLVPSSSAPRIGGRIAPRPPPTLVPTDAQPISMPEPSKLSAREAMRSGLAMALDWTGTDDAPKRPGSQAKTHVDSSDIFYAAKALGLGTALALSLFGFGTVGVMKALDVDDIPSFHARMRQLLGLRVLAANEALKPHTEFLRVAEVPEEEDQAALAALEMEWAEGEAEGAVQSTQVNLEAAS